MTTLQIRTSILHPPPDPRPPSYPTLLRRTQHGRGHIPMAILHISVLRTSFLHNPVLILSIPLLTLLHLFTLTSLLSTRHRAYPRPLQRLHSGKPPLLAPLRTNLRGSYCTQTLMILYHLRTTKGSLNCPLSTLNGAGRELLAPPRVL
jgi:hypothetical protein